MTTMIVTRKTYWFRPDSWEVVWRSNARNWFQYGNKPAFAYFETLEKVLDWAKKNAWAEPWPGGGHYPGITLYLDGFVIAEFWRQNEKWNERIYIKPFNEAMSQTGNYPKGEK